eukprot:TRINITY_DN13630_c0_g1_i2.p1 TRINITY_DN13630_c0_g1~~TRINITY_DN13630_c0_g1_i2.p1  ORF type:complete len:528 (+),score=87.54 TRINITY_DN13630_c0_g1_i2:354-1937(+)
MVGAAAACAIACNPLLKGLRLAVVDGNLKKASQGASPSCESRGDSEARPPDARVVAISPASAELLQEVGVWEKLKAERHVTPFDTMQVWDHAGPGYVRFKAQDVAGQTALGYIMENQVLVNALQERLQDLGCEMMEASVVALQSGGQQETSTSSQSGASFVYTSPRTSNSSEGLHGASFSKAGLDRGKMNSDSSAAHEGEASTDCSKQGGSFGEAAEAVDGQRLNREWPEVRLSTGNSVAARLLIAADGGRSRVREMAKLGTWGWAYEQRAVIATVGVDRIHSTAWQRFLPSGPLALLPCGDRYSNIVWSTTPQQAQDLETMSEDAFVASINAALHDLYAPPPSSQSNSTGQVSPFDRLLPFDSLLPFKPTLPFRAFLNSLSSSDAFEKPPLVDRVFGARLSFPLSLAQAKEYATNRLVLLGDAAHTCHPLAGQGVNLGLADAAALVKALGTAARNGGDIGQASVLSEYSAKRGRANLGALAGLDALQRVFPIQFPPFAFSRNLGLQAVQALGPLKARLMDIAMRGM